jgi:hypothetical protein
VISDCLRGRSLITTENGYVGLAPDNVQRSDLIVMFVGYFSPVVLRRSTPEASRYYLIAGQCFVQGFMSVEAFLGLLLVNVQLVYRIPTF